MPRPIEKMLTLKFIWLMLRSPTVTWLWTCSVWLKVIPITPTFTSTAMLFVAKATIPGEIVPAQRDVLAPDGCHLIGVLQGVVVLGVEAHVRVGVAEVDRGLVEFEQRPRVDEAAAQGHVVAEGVGDHRADLEGVAFRVDAFDDQELVAFVRMGRVGGRTSEYPLALRNEEVVRIGQTAPASHLVDRQGTMCGAVRRGLPDGFCHPCRFCRRSLRLLGPQRAAGCRETRSEEQQAYECRAHRFAFSR